MTTKTKNEIIVCKVEELANGQRKIVSTDRMKIVVVKMNNQLYAFNNMCPHQGAPLAFGSISGAMEKTEPQMYKYGCHNEVVRCPLHGWAFDMKTGESLFSKKVKIKTFDVREENGNIILTLKGKNNNVTISDGPYSCSQAI